jgi:heme exporter protein D
MSYHGYVVAAYAVFAIVMLWDLVVPRLELRRQLRAARLRAARRSAAVAAPDPSAPLLRD